MSETFRSVTHGTCALDGRHTPGSLAEAECPLLSRQDRAAARQAIRAAKAHQASPAQQAARQAAGERMRKSRVPGQEPAFSSVREG